MNDHLQAARQEEGRHQAGARIVDLQSARPVLEFAAVDKTYKDGTYALAPVDLRIQDGEFVSFIGPSGCGKSTLLKLGANLMAPSNGTIRWWGEGADKIGSEGCRFSFVFQQPTLMPWATIADNVRLPLQLAGGDALKGADARIRDALKLVGLADFSRHLPRRLSGGMMMRASIARALVTEPNMLFMDEPFGALDEFTRNELDSNILSLWAERGLTVLFVTHSISEAVFLSTRIVVMSARPGRIYSEIHIDETQRDEKFRTSADFAEYCRRLSIELIDATHA